MQKVRLTIISGDETQIIETRRGLGFQAALCHSAAVEFDCRKADCGICAVRILSGAEHLSPMTPSERDFLRAMAASPDERLACQTRLFGDVRIEVNYL